MFTNITNITNLTKIRYAFLAMLFIAIAVFGFSKINGNNVNADTCTGTVPNTPAWNIWPLSFTPQPCKDLPLIDAKVLNGSGRDGRYAQDQSEHDAGITVKPGDQVRLIIYFHNGASAQNQATATARNTRIILNTGVWNSNFASSHTFGATLYSDNSAFVKSSDASRGGDITLSSAQPVKLDYVSGSTQLCIKYQAAVERKNAGQNVDLTKTCGTDSNGQPQVLIDMPDGIISGAYGIGDVPACFPYAGFLVFTANVSAQVVAPTNTTIALDKTVRNITAGQSTFAKSVNANTGDQVEFQIALDNSGPAMADSVIIRDALPAGLSYVPGSSTVGNPAPGGNTVALPDMWITTGTSSTIVSGASSVFKFKATVNAPSGTLVNTVTGQGQNTNSATSSASVVVTPAPAPIGTTITVQKLVRNASTNQTNFVKIASATASDQVEFQLKVTNTGTQSAVVNIKDSLPSGLTFVPGSINFGSTYNVMFTSGATILVGPGVTYTITFKASVVATSGTERNSVTVSSTAAPSVTDTADVNITPIVVPPPSNTTLDVNKTVRNVTTGQNSFADSASAKIGETVEFQVVVTNTGSTTTATAVNVKDVLPSGLSFVPNSVVLSGAGSNVLTQALVTPAGITFNINPSASATFTFKATVNVNSGTLVNTASAQGSNTNFDSDTAQVIVTAAPVVVNTLTIKKEVRDLTSGQTAYSNRIQVAKNDTVQYRIIVTNTGNGAISNISVTDNIPSNISVTANSFGISIPGNTSTLSNIIISSLAAGQSVTINYSATVNAECTRIVNTAQAVGTQASASPSSATLEVACAPAPQQGTLSITKLVKNLTQNTASFVSQVNANQGDRIAYQIEVTANGGNVTNVTLRDILPGHFNYAAGSARLNSAALSDTFTTSQVNIGHLSKNQKAVISFEGNIASNLPVGQTNLVNTATASGDNLGSVSATATATVNVSGGNPGFTQMRIAKQVRNVTTNTGFQENVNAQNAESVAFQITITNSGTLVLNNVYVSDILPSGLTLKSGTVRVNGNSNSDILVSNRLTLGAMSPNQQHIVTFEATVSATGNTTLTNVAQAGADNFSQIQDNATVSISAVQGSFISIALSKRAHNDSKNIDATAIQADQGDLITYALTVVNNGNAPATNYIIADDLSQVLNYAILVDPQGGIMNGNVISWAAMQVPAFGSVTKSFRVQVKTNLPAGSYSLVNTFGNTLTVPVKGPAVLGVFVAPKTGPTGAYAFGFAALVTMVFAILKKKGAFKVLAAKISKIS